MDKATEVAQRCNGIDVDESVRRSVLALKIGNDIAAVRKDVLAFVSANGLVLDGKPVSASINPGAGW